MNFRGQHTEGQRANQGQMHIMYNICQHYTNGKNLLLCVMEVKSNFYVRSRSRHFVPVYNLFEDQQLDLQRVYVITSWHKGSDMSTQVGKSLIIITSNVQSHAD